VSKFNVRLPVGTVRRVDCSKLSDPQPRNSCRQYECLFSEQWGSKAGASGVCDQLAIVWPACSRHAATPEASAGYEELVRCGRVG